MSSANSFQREEGYNCCMCGRISFKRNFTELAEYFDAKGQIPQEYSRPKVNIPPSTRLPVIVPGPAIMVMRWGLTERGFPINLRTDNLMKGPNARLLSRNRCIVPADGFYEWNPQKMPTRFELKDKSKLFPMAAVFTQHGFSLFTCDPNSVVSKTHHRMPVILKESDISKWLDAGEQDIERMFLLLGPYPADLMEDFPVERTLNTPANDFFKRIS